MMQCAINSISEAVTKFQFRLKIQGESLARGPQKIWEKYSRIWRNAFKCPWMWKETSFSIDYEPGPVLHRSRYVYINFQVIISIT